jgi:hypothetical protein
MKLPFLPILCAAALSCAVGMASADPDKDESGKGREPPRVFVREGLDGQKTPEGREAWEGGEAWLLLPRAWLHASY